MTDKDKLTVISVEILPAAEWATPLKYGSAAAIGEMSDGHDEIVLCWYDDELHFVESDFIGKTIKEIKALWFEKDQAYLRS